MSRHRQSKYLRVFSASNTLTLTVVVLVLAGVAAISWISIKEFQVQQSVYTSILKQKLEATRSQLSTALSPFPNHLATLESWHQAGLLPLDDADALAALLTPLLEQHPQVAALYLVPPTGPSYSLLRKGDTWLGGFQPETKDSCRQQAWYTNSLAGSREKHHQWSGYVFLPGLGETGLVSATGSDDLVIGLAMRKQFLDGFSKTTPITENGILIRRFDDGQLAWLTPHQKPGMNLTSSSEMLTSDLPEHQIIGRALLAWGEKGQPYRQPLEFNVNGTTWWCAMYSAIDQSDPGELGMIVPASDLSARLKTVSGRVMWLIAAILALATLAVVVQAISLSRKWRRFSRRRLIAPKTERELQLMVNEGESDQVEFKSTMRWNLKADKPGKEIEKAWLKSVVAYLNTSGGFLIIGVADDGTVLGLEQDKFKNEDKFLLHFDNLIKQHIGLEYAGFIRGEIRSLGEQNVFLVACDRCPDGVHLKLGDNEDFYIRMGPSTRSLPGSRVMDYLQERES